MRSNSDYWALVSSQRVAEVIYSHDLFYLRLVHYLLEVFLQVFIGVGVIVAEENSVIVVLKSVVEAENVVSSGDFLLLVFFFLLLFFHQVKL